MNEVYCYSTRKNKPKLSIAKKIVMFCIFLFAVFLIIFNVQIIPVLEPYAKAAGTTAVTSKIQNIIQNAFSEEFEDIVKLRYDESGNVVSLETNTLKISTLNAEIVQKITKELENDNRLAVKIPLGNLTGGAIFTGRGPDLTIPLSVSPKIECNISNEFFESGINQTLHRIVAKIDVETFILIPSASKKMQVETKVCLAETVIVGKVPDAYTKINRFYDDISESEIDDIYDFGAY